MLKRVHAYPKDLSNLEYFGVATDIEFPAIAFQDYYPQQSRLRMMRDSLRKLPDMDYQRRLRIINLLNRVTLTNKQKFDKFVEILTQQELNWIGW